MLLLCDVNEYRKCVSTLKIPLINKLFESLHALCNLLVVPPEHLSAACTADLLVSSTFFNTIEERHCVGSFFGLCFRIMYVLSVSIWVRHHLLLGD